jgi:hypothetical protein
MDPRFVSWDTYTTFNDGTNFESYFSVGAITEPISSQSVYVDRPAPFGPFYSTLRRTVKPFELHIKIVSGNFATQLNVIKQRFNPTDTERKKLIIKDAANSDKEWYAYCKPIALKLESVSLITVVMERTTDWYEEVESTASWTVTATGQTKDVTPAGNLPARPVFTITPRAAKTAGSAAHYRRFVRVRNRAGVAAANYAIELTDGGWDTTVPIGAGIMLSTGDDLRVLVNGVEVPRWIDGINTASTKVWTVLDLQPNAGFLLDGAIAAGGGVSTIPVKYTQTALSKMQRMPSEGIIAIDNELFYYFGKRDQDPYDLAFLNTVRAVCDSSAAAHLDNTLVHWIQYEIYITHGDNTLPAPDQDESRKPVFRLDTSSNTSWDYDNFTELYKNRAGAFTPRITTGYAWAGPYFHAYRGDSAQTMSNANEAPGMGGSGELTGTARGVTAWGYINWDLYHPIGFTHVAADGKRYKSSTALDSYNYNLWFCSSVNPLLVQADTPTVFATVVKATAALADEAWSVASTAVGGTDYYLQFKMLVYGSDRDGNAYASRFTVNNVTLTLDSTRTPVVTFGAQVGTGYRLTAKLTNTTTGEWLLFNFITDIDQTLEVDCESKKLTYLKDNSPVHGALVAFSSIRADWLNLLPGQVNTLQWDETGVQDCDIGIAWRDRNN